MSAGVLRSLSLLCAPALLALVACGGTDGPSSVPIGPSVMTDLGALRPEQDRRNEQLRSAAVRPGPETRKPLPGVLNTVETAAATTAAVLGIFFSKSSNALVGTAIPLDAPAPPRRRAAEDEPNQEDEPAEPIDASQLTPWVKLGPPEQPSE
jgi:hypothetical protein